MCSGTIVTRARVLTSLRGQLLLGSVMRWRLVPRSGHTETVLEKVGPRV